jgi:hypothetical protein
MSEPSELRLPDAALLARMAASDNGFVFDPVSGNSFTLNPTGLDLFRIFLRHRVLKEVLAEVGAEYEVRLPEVERDILEFAAVLSGSLKP